MSGWISKPTGWCGPCDLKPGGLPRHGKPGKAARSFPEEDWGFTAQQALEKLLKAWIVLADRQPPKVQDLADLAVLAGQALDPLLRQLQVFAVEARDEEGPLPLPAQRQ
jgi:hypothetical protein